MRTGSAIALKPPGSPAGGLRIEDYLSAVPEPRANLLLRELILLDIDYRRHAGERPAADEYLERFPALNRAWITAAVAKDARTQVHAADRSMQSTLAHLASASSSVAWKALESCIEALTKDWAHGEPRPLVAYLPSGDAVLRKATLTELVKVELELQWKAGRRPTLRDYCAWYPELGSKSDLSADLVHEAWHVARRHGEYEELEVFCREFPEQRPVVEQMAQLDTISATVRSARSPATDVRSGAKLDDFELLELLGEGGFSRVFLAWQLSLEREVALKVSAAATREAATVASLEHDHIVRVFSESIDASTELHLLCMQHIAGPTLAQIIRWRNDHPRTAWTGELLLAAIDALSHRPASFQKAAFENRQMLIEADLEEAVCWIGARLADALAFAHQRGVLHRDIKPANILMDQYGRPFLTDFNLSSATGKTAGPFGGTCGYMAPEHLLAFIGQGDTAPESVEVRSDIYSLGVVLYELSVGTRPLPNPAQGSDRNETLQDMAETMLRQPAPDPRQANGTVSPALARIVRSCLEPQPQRRPQSAGELAASLDAARELRSMEKSLPRGGWLTRLALERPICLVFSLVFAPHMFCVALNVAYVAIVLAGGFSERQMTVYIVTAIVYSIIAFGTTGVLSWRMTVPKQIAWNRLARGEDVASDELLAARRRTLTMPLWGAAFSLAGWAPGSVVFPTALYLFGGPAPAGVLVHLVLLYLLCGLISFAYSYFASEFVDLRAGYLRFLMDDRTPRDTARRELRSVGKRLRLFQFLAGAIPLVAALIMIIAGPGAGDDSALVFRGLMGAVILLSGLGFCISMLAAHTLYRTLEALSGAHATLPSRSLGSSLVS